MLKNKWREYRPYILRAVAAILIWSLLIFAFINSFAARNYSNKALSRIKAATEFSETFYTEQKAIEVAKLFVSDFLNFSDREDYKNRMSKYGSNYKIPSGLQKVNRVYFMDKELTDEGIYRITLTVNLDREAFSETLHNIPKDKIISQEDKSIRYYKEVEETYIVSVTEDLQVLGTPVIQPLQIATASKMNIKGNSCPPEFKVFTEQVMDLYFKGGELNNFTSPKADKIRSIGNYEVVKYGIEGFENTENEAIALVNVTVKSEEITYDQQIIIEAVKQSDKWLLTRIGGM